MVPSKSRQNFLYDLAMVSKKPYMMFGMILKIFHESGSLGRAAGFRYFSHQWNILWSWIWYLRNQYGLGYGI